MVSVVTPHLNISGIGLPDYRQCTDGLPRIHRGVTRRPKEAAILVFGPQFQGRWWTSKYLSHYISATFLCSITWEQFREYFTIRITAYFCLIFCIYSFFKFLEMCGGNKKYREVMIRKCGPLLGFHAHVISWVQSALRYAFQ